MTFIFFAWIGSTLYGVEVVAGKFISKYSIKNPMLFGFTQTVMYVCMLIPIALIRGASIPSNFTLVLVLGLGRAISSVLYYLSLYKNDVTILGPMFNIRMIFGLILASAFLDERLNTIDLLLIALILIGGLLVNIEEKMHWKAFLKPAVGLAILMTLAIAINDILTNRSIDANSYWTSILWSESISLVFMLPIIRFFHRDVKTQISRKSLAATYIVALITTIAGLAVFKAFSMNVGITSVIMAIPFSMIITLLLSIFKPNLLEKHTARIYAIRIFAATIMIISAFLLSKSQA